MVGCPGLTDFVIVCGVARVVTVSGTSTDVVGSWTSIVSDHRPGSERFAPSPLHVPGAARRRSRQDRATSGRAGNAKVIDTPVASTGLRVS